METKTVVVLVREERYCRENTPQYYNEKVVLDVSFEEAQFILRDLEEPFTNCVDVIGCFEIEA
jgi:hypothetical protein